MAVTFRCSGPLHLLLVLTVLMLCCHLADAQTTITLINTVTSGTNVVGTVEVNYQNTKKYICEDKSSDAEAMVICNQYGAGYGFGKVVREARPSETSLIGSQSMVIRPSCVGNEADIMTCPTKLWSGFWFNWCGNFALKVKCSKPFVTASVKGNLRLVALPGTRYVQVSNEYGLWGGVCTNAREKSNADVVCRQLGYSGGKMTASSTITGTYSLSKNCKGKAKLADCSGFYFSNYLCSSAQSMQVSCDIWIQYDKFDIYMETDAESFEPVNIWMNGTWNRICADNMANEDKVAVGNTVCKQVKTGKFLAKAEGSALNDVTSQTTLLALNCTGSKSEIEQCVKIMAPSGKAIKCDSFLHVKCGEIEDDTDSNKWYLNYGIIRGVFGGLALLIFGGVGIVACCIIICQKKKARVTNLPRITNVGASGYPARLGQNVVQHQGQSQLQGYAAPLQPQPQGYGSAPANQGSTQLQGYGVGPPAQDSTQLQGYWVNPLTQGTQSQSYGAAPDDGSAPPSYRSAMMQPQMESETTKEVANNPNFIPDAPTYADPTIRY